MRRFGKVVVWGLVLAFVLAAVAAFLLPGDKVTRANFERISRDMSEGDVEEILGLPSDRLRPLTLSPGLILTVESKRYENANGQERNSYWYGQRGRIAVVFNQTHRVVAAELCEYPQLDPLQRIKKWLGL